MNALAPGVLPVRARPAAAMRAEAGEGGGDPVDFARLFATLWRGKFWLAAWAVAGAMAAGLWAGWIAVPVYRATAVLVMAPDTVAATGLEGVVPGLGGDSVAVNTEVEIMRSRRLLRRLAGELQLVADPEFNPALRPPSPPGALAARLRRALGRPAPSPVPALPGTVDSLERLVVVRSVPDSRVFEVTAESRSPARAAEIANTLAGLYLAQQVELKQAEAAQAAAWLGERVAELQLALETADSRARAFAAEMELVSPESLQALAAQLKEIRQRILARESGAGAARLAQLRGMERALADQLARQSQDLVALRQLQLETEASRLIYEHFLGRLKETSVQRGTQTADSRILSGAEVPVEPAWPQPLLAAALAGFLAALAASVGLLARAAGRAGFESFEALEAATGLPVLAELPAAGRGAGDAALRGAATELRAALVQGEGTGSLLLTAPVDTDAPVALATALADSLSALGQSVLLIAPDEADGPGLGAVLAGEAGVERAVVAGRIDRLGIEPDRDDLDDRLAGPALAEFAAAARSCYGAVVVVAEPPRALLLAGAAQRSVVAVAAGTTSPAALSRTLRRLDRGPAPPIGLVLTGAASG